MFSYDAADNLIEVKDNGLRAQPDKDRMRRVDSVQPQRPSWSSSQGGASSESGIQ